MSEQSPSLSLPYIQPAQAQKHVTHNEAVELLDTIVQLAIEDINVSAPPTTPTDGQTWSIGLAATGSWTGQDGKLATWKNNGWLYLAPKDGWIAWVEGQSAFYAFDGSDWVPLTTSVDLENVSGVGINTTSDAANPLSVSGQSTLLSHAGNGHQLKLNKAASSDTASMLFQTGFSGRAEIGLAGTDALSVKLSDDGSTWVDTLLLTSEKTTLRQLVNIEPSAEPLTPTAGDVYFDSTTAKLRCHNGSIWNDLF